MMVRLANQVSPFAQLQQQMDLLLENFFDDAPTRRGFGRGYPGLNLWEDAGAYMVRAELPGLSLEDVEVMVTGSELTIKGQRKITAPEAATYHRRERATGQFTRTINLPTGVEINPDQVTAKLVDGVLTVTLPKTPAAQPRKVKLLSA